MFNYLLSLFNNKDHRVTIIEFGQQLTWPNPCRWNKYYQTPVSAQQFFVKLDTGNYTRDQIRVEQIDGVLVVEVFADPARRSFLDFLKNTGVVIDVPRNMNPNFICASLSDGVLTFTYDPPQ